MLEGSSRTTPAAGSAILAVTCLLPILQKAIMIELCLADRDHEIPAYDSFGLQQFFHLSGKYFDTQGRGMIQVRMTCCLHPVFVLHQLASRNQSDARQLKTEEYCAMVASSALSPVGSDMAISAASRSYREFYPAQT